MKLAVLQCGILCGLVWAAVAIGGRSALGAWGITGLTSLRAAAWIALIPALVAAIPAGLAWAYRPAWAPHVALAGTGVRLLGTAGAGFAYQMVAQPDFMAFSTSLVAIYLVLLVAETTLIVYMVSRARRPGPTSRGVET